MIPNWRYAGPHLSSGFVFQRTASALNRTVALTLAPASEMVDAIHTTVSLGYSTVFDESHEEVILTGWCWHSNQCLHVPRCAFHKKLLRMWSRIFFDLTDDIQIPYVGIYYWSSHNQFCEFISMRWLLSWYSSMQHFVIHQLMHVSTTCCVRVKHTTASPWNNITISMYEIYQLRLIPDRGPIAHQWNPLWPLRLHYFRRTAPDNVGW